MVSRKIYRQGFIILVLILIANPNVWALPESKPLINGTSIYLSPGESWIFYQGYSLNLKSMSEAGDQGWVQLKLNDTVLKTEIMSRGDTFIYNVTNWRSKEIMLFRITVSGIYSGEENDIITFSPVFQYYDSNLPQPTPLPTILPFNHSNSSNTTTHTDDNSVTHIPGFLIIQIAIIISLCIILIRRFS